MWGVFVIVVAVACIKRAMLALGATALIGVLPTAYTNWSHAQSQAGSSESSRAELRSAAWDHFRGRCALGAGEKILRTVDGVEGIFLARPRKQPSEKDLRDQYWMGDPYGLVMYPPAEISRYLNFLNREGRPTKERTARKGFDYVVTDSGSGGFLEYRLDESNEKLVVKKLEAQPSRYSIVWRDISTDEDRKYWVAGGSLQIVDLSTMELLGERVGYVFESGFGSTAGGRVPWLVARRSACPPIPRNFPIDRHFVERVLRPKGIPADGQ